MGETTPVEKLVRTFLKIRTARSELKAEFEEKDKGLSRQLDIIKEALLSHCKETGATSVRTEDGTFYRTIKRRYWTDDWDSMHKFILEQGELSLLDKRINQANMKQFLEENPDMVPKGLNADTEYVISVRKK